MTGLKDISRQKNLHQESLQDGHHLHWAKWRWNKDQRALHDKRFKNISAYTPDYYSTTVSEKHSTSPTAHLPLMEQRPRLTHHGCL